MRFKNYSIIRVFFRKINSKKKKRLLKKKHNHFNTNDLIADLKSLGIKKSDVVFVHSSLSKIGYVEKGASTVIDALLNVVGEKGTLVIPTYFMKGTMYNTCVSENYVFDRKKSPTVLGAIPLGFLKRDGISRSIHPTHSVSAIGMNAKKITYKHHIGNKTYGENSPWGKILELNGKFLGIGINLGPTTQYHYIEDVMGEEFPLKVKIDKLFKLKCKIGKKKYIFVNVQPLDPEIAKTRIDQKDSQFIRDYFWEIFEKANVLHIGKVGEACSWWAYAKEFFNLLYKLTNLGITIYGIKDDLIKKGLYPFDSIKEKLKILK